MASSPSAVAAGVWGCPALRPPLYRQQRRAQRRVRSSSTPRGGSSRPQGPCSRRRAVALRWVLRPSHPQGRPRHQPLGSATEQGRAATPPLLRPLLDQGRLVTGPLRQMHPEGCLRMSSSSRRRHGSRRRYGNSSRRRSRSSSSGCGLLPGLTRRRSLRIRPLQAAPQLPWQRVGRGGDRTTAGGAKRRLSSQSHLQRPREPRPEITMELPAAGGVRARRRHTAETPPRSAQLSVGPGGKAMSTPEAGSQKSREVQRLHWRRQGTEKQSQSQLNPRSENHSAALKSFLLFLNQSAWLLDHFTASPYTGCALV